MGSLVSQHTAKVYHFRWPNLGGWAVWMVDDKTGSLSLVSDWGDYGYRWNMAAIGVGLVTTGPPAARSS